MLPVILKPVSLAPSPHFGYWKYLSSDKMRIFFFNMSYYLLVLPVTISDASLMTVLAEGRAASFMARVIFSYTASKDFKIFGAEILQSTKHHANEREL